MNDEKIRQLSETARQIRINAVKAVYSANSGHPGGSLSIAEMLACLYFSEMNIDPADPKAENRDRFVLSKGHCAPAYYSALALRGYFEVSELTTFRSISGRLQGHPDMKHIPGVDMSTGSLGMGISAACGMALAGRNRFRAYTILGDGECQEGEVWEAAMLAAHYKLDNLVAMVDFNGLQIGGKITDVMNPTPFDQKFSAFGWDVSVVDGHNIEEILGALAHAREVKGKPSVIICHTVKGKGVSFMENNAKWHGSAPNAEQYAQAMKELGGEI
ncbi:MAG: transketolase [Eubacteriales bacterium]